MSFIYISVKKKIKKTWNKNLLFVTKLNKKNEKKNCLITFTLNNLDCWQQINVLTIDSISLYNACFQMSVIINIFGLK